jgi:hypothetical protein
MQTPKDRIALGLEIARQLGEEGNRILIGARDALERMGASPRPKTLRE